METRNDELRRTLTTYAKELHDIFRHYRYVRRLLRVGDFVHSREFVSSAGIGGGSAIEMSHGEFIKFVKVRLGVGYLILLLLLRGL